MHGDAEVNRTRSGSCYNWAQSLVLGEPDGNQIIIKIKCEIASVKKERHIVMCKCNTSKG